MKAKTLAALLMKRPECEVVFKLNSDSEYMYAVGAPTVLVLSNHQTNSKEEVLALLNIEVPSSEFSQS